MAFKMFIFALAVVALGRAGCDAYNISGPELTQRLEFSDDALQFNYPTVSIYACLAKIGLSLEDISLVLRSASKR